MNLCRRRQREPGSGTVYVLGAGASKFVGYPLASELWGFLRDYKTKESREKEAHRKAIGAIEPIIQRLWPAGRDSPNLELLFTLLDLRESAPDALGFEHLAWKDVRDDLIRSLAARFQAHHHDMLLGRPIAADLDLAARPNGLVSCWADRVRDGDALISFNWDLLHEYALHKAGKWSLSGGYGFPTHDKGGPSRVVLLKLHGSCNWAQFEPGQNPKVLYSDTLCDCAPTPHDDYLAEASPDGGAKSLVIPSYIKRLTPFLYSIWAQADRALRDCGQVVVLGYSLNEADVQANYLFHNSLANNVRHPTVKLVNGPGACCETWLKLEGTARCTVENTKLSFEDWLHPVQPPRASVMAD